MTTCGSTLTACVQGSVFNSSCRHLFPRVPGHTSGDGSFNLSEERFWGTNPNDPDTADNGNKDEANIVGLGQSSLTWNYVTGDQIGVAVEGTSMIPTKYNDASSMIMWAFPKKDCPISLNTGTGSFFTSIKGYSVNMVVAEMDLNKCLERNLVDPTEGGQAKNLEVSVAATPDTPVNDETNDAAGDIVVAQASVSNAAHSVSSMLFDWDVEISDNVQFRNSSSGDAAKVTTDLQALQLLGNTKGVALDSLRLKLDIKANTSLGGQRFSNYLSSGIGYLRFTAKATENFSSGIARKGKSDVVVQFTSTGEKITAYKVDTRLAGTEMRVALPNPLSSGVICNDDPLDRAVCRTIKNEIIGLRIEPAGLSHFHWTINGAALACSRAAVSFDCGSAEQNHVNFFPVSGDVGDTYTVAVTANDVLTGKAITLTRVFHVIAPKLTIKSADVNAAWPKLLGQYKDLTVR